MRDGGGHIWYLLDCCKQEEVKILNLCRRILSKEAAKDMFLLTYDQMRRYEGVWHTEKKLMFPSYVFLESENEKFLREVLDKNSKELFPVEKPGKNGHLIRIDREVEELLKYLCGNTHHLEMSKGIIQKGVPRIIAGPLKGMEDRICRIDRHKRLAKLAVPVERNLRYITAGLEIEKKSM